MRGAESKASMIGIRLCGRFDKPAVDANWSATTPTAGEINLSLFILTHDAPELFFIKRLSRNCLSRAVRHRSEHQERG